MASKRYKSLVSSRGVPGAPSVISDGSTVAWYDSSDLTTVTKDGANLVSVWADKLGSGRNLLQAGADAIKPVWSADGILFDGVDNFMKTAAFTYAQPVMIYIVFKQVTWTNNEYIFDGNLVSSCILRQIGTTPDMALYAGAAANVNSNLAVDTWGIVRVLFSGAASKLIVNETTPVTGNPGTQAMGGFTLASRGDGAGLYPNIQVKEIILRKIADSAGDEVDIYNYLKTKYGL